MTRVTAGPVCDARPPEGVVRMTNPILRGALRSPIGRWIRGLAIIDHVGRRSGERRRVVVAWHELDGRAFAITPAAWRANFRDGATAQVRHRGRTRAMHGTLVADTETVAATLRTFFEAGGSPTSCGLRVEDGHTITAHDTSVVNRAIVWLDSL